MNDFDAAWDTMHESSQCDKRGGREYHRCRADWYFSGRYKAALAFIRITANLPAPPVSNRFAADPPLPDNGV